MARASIIDGNAPLQRIHEEVREIYAADKRPWVVGYSGGKENALARRFRDEAGRLNQQVAQAVDEVMFIAAGLPLRLK